MFGNSSSDSLTDPSRLLLDLADSLPTNAERERGLSLLAHRLAQLPALPADLVPLTLRLARRDLLELYSGFALGTFVTAVKRFRPRRAPPAFQLHLHERLAVLLTLPPTRDEAFRWALAALRGELHDLLRQHFRQSPPFRRLLTGLGLTAASSLSPSEGDRTPEYEFGLTLLHLLGGDDQPFLPDPLFSALLQTLDGWVSDFPYFPEGRLRDLFPLLGRFSLSEAQRAALLERLTRWSDQERFPSERPFPRRSDYIRALARAWGWRGPLAALAEWTARFLRPGPVAPSSDAASLRRDRAMRLSTLILALGSLAPQEEAALALALDLFAELTHQQLLSLSLGGSIECQWALIDLLPGLLAHPAWLERLTAQLEEVRFYNVSDLALDDLVARRLTLSRPALRALLDLRRRLPHHSWIRQVWETCAGLEPAAEAWLTAELRAAPDPVLLEFAIVLASRSSIQRIAPDLSDALAFALTRLLNSGATLDPAWAPGLLHNREALRQVFLRLAEGGATRQMSAPLRDFLRALSEAVNERAVLSPALLAACWLAAPEDDLQSGLPLAERRRRELVERLSLAAQILAARRSEAETLGWLARVLPPSEASPERQRRLQERPDPPALRVTHRFPRLQAILFEGWAADSGTRSGAPRRRALARALASASPSLALPLLRGLFTLACEMYQAWYLTERYYTELYREAGPLAEEIARSLVTLSPLLPEAVTLLRDLLLTHETLPEGGFSELNPQFVRTQLLPHLVNKPVHESALPLLLDLVQHPPAETTPHRRELLRQVALQALSNVRTLDTAQQQALWESAYASPQILTRALSLLVLGRQRPLSEPAWSEVNRLLRLSPSSLLAARRREIRRLPEAQRELIFGPGDVFLLGGVAVALAAEWLTEGNLLVLSRRADLLDTLRRAASEFNRSLEERLAESIHPHLGMEASSARSLALSLCDALGRSPADDPDWLTHPADIAASVGQAFSLSF